MSDTNKGCHSHGSDTWHLQFIERQVDFGAKYVKLKIVIDAGVCLTLSLKETKYYKLGAIVVYLL